MIPKFEGGDFKQTNRPICTLMTSFSQEIIIQSICTLMTSFSQEILETGHFGRFCLVYVRTVGRKKSEHSLKPAQDIYASNDI